MLKRFVVTLMALCLVMALAGIVVAQVEAPKAKTETHTGTVEVKKDAEGNVTEVSLKVSDTKTYGITLDAKGKEMATLSDKKVEVKGTVKNSTITVESYKEVVKKVQ
ncbi:MAG TPA: hypothetical protein VM492_03905 [Sumerlaeia bacterium]|nr:hypothetical protein [Sumerlaeia bacterium]